MTPIGPILQSFFVDYLQALKGLRPLSVRSYRDTMRLFLAFVAAERRRKISRLLVEDFTYELAQRFLRHLEERRRNSVRTRNQRLAIIRAFFDYLASRIPERIAVAERVSAIPTKRTPPPETRFLERADVQRLLAALPSKGRRALRDRALLLFLYNTGARVQETADLRIGQLDLDGTLRVRLHGKGDKWRVCPLWPETARQLRDLVSQRTSALPEASVFCSSRDRPLTRFGIYKIVRRHARLLEQGGPKMHARRISPHVFRHTAAVHLLESGVEVNVIRGWLGHVSLETTNRYAEITTPMKEAALRACEPQSDLSEAFPRKPVWRDDAALLAWLDSL
ncbi:MAG TPA: tyrosine-type recombinase/integrase [Polyangiaceae bacterium]